MIHGINFDMIFKFGQIFIFLQKCFDPWNFLIKLIINYAWNANMNIQLNLMSNLSNWAVLVIVWLPELPEIIPKAKYCRVIIPIYHYKIGI